MRENTKNGILCMFALVCVAILLSTSLVVLAGNGNDSKRSSSSYELESCMHVDEDGYIVAVYDETHEFVGERERLGERTPSNTEVDIGRLTYETHSDYTLTVVDHDGSQKKLVVPDKVELIDKTWIVTEIGDKALGVHSSSGRQPKGVEIGPFIERLGEYSFSDGTGSGKNMTEFKIRDIDESRLKKIEAYAFFGTCVKSIELPKSLDRIGHGAFSLSGIETVILHSESLVIEESAFLKSEVRQINLENVRRIDGGAFMQTKLTAVDLSSATEIGEDAFWCRNLSYVKFSSELTSLHDGTFMALFYGVYQFYDTDHNKLDQCAEDLRGKTFVREDMSTCDFIQTL